MIDERFVYDFVTVFCYVFAIYRLFFRKPEESFFAFFDELHRSEVHGAASALATTSHHERSALRSSLGGNR